MKQTLFLLLFIGIISHVSGQDIITTVKGDTILCKVTTITDKTVLYRIYTGSDSVVRSIDKIAVSSIRYPNGVREYLNDANVSYADTDARSMAELGRRDAIEYYDGYRGARAATITTAIVGSPIYGLIPAIVCSSTPPKDHNLGYPDEKLIENDEYYTAYKKEARHIKSKKVWGGYAIGSGVYAGITIIGAVLLIVLMSGF